MLSLPDARRLLESARSDDGLRECAAALGFTRSTPVGPELQEKLGIAGLAERFEISESRGSLRALTTSFKSDVLVRDVLALIAARLSFSVPHLLWIVFSVDGDSHVGISVWQADGSRPRIFALLADRRRISDSDAQTFCALASLDTSSDSLTHLRWTEILGREAITIRFFRALRSVIDNLAASLEPGIPRNTSSDLALTYVSRLLFLSFVESKGWMNRDHDFLSNSFIQCMTSGGSYHRKVLSPLFFGTLNTPIAKRASHARTFGRIPFLNGGLFGRTPAERALRFEFPDDSLGLVFGDLLTRYRFTEREQSTDLSESAIDPEILGRAFESLMQAESRKSSGAFYTPQPVVKRVADAALEISLCNSCVQPEQIQQLLNGVPLNERDATLTLERMTQLRILDPACGSGAFLVYLLEMIAAMRTLCGDNRPASERRRDVLANSIFGVDINPTAVWLCELRLWLSVVVGSQVTDPTRVLPLPNLDRNIRVGDSLGAKPLRHPGSPPCDNVERTRLRYIRSVGARKKLLGRVLEKMERRNAIALLTWHLETIAAERRDLLTAARSRNLFGERSANPALQKGLTGLRERRKDATNSLLALRAGSALPFSFETHFADVMQAGGFHLVVGNPPWVRVHRMAKSSRAFFKRDFELCRATGWSIGASKARAGSGFAHQLDLSALFVERSLNIARDDGCIALILPSKLWKSLAGGSVRFLISKSSDIQILEDFSAAKALFDATTYPSLLVVRKGVEVGSPRRAPIRAAVHRRSEVLHWTMSPDLLPLDQSPGSPWLILPQEVRAGFDALASRGTPLADSSFGRPMLGVKTGSNDVYIMSLVRDDGATSQMTCNDSEVTIETRLLRKVIKGDSIRPWRISPGIERIIWTHGSDGQPLPELPPLASTWFRKWRKELSTRTDARTQDHWWRVFRTEAAGSSLHRVVWSDIGRIPRAAVIPAGDESIPLNTCYVVACKYDVDANALAALINSPLIAAWLSLIAEPAQGGYKRYLGWTMALLPVPRKWEENRAGLSKLYVRACSGDLPSPSEVFEKTLVAYGLAEEDVHDMMIWAHP